MDIFMQGHMSRGESDGRVQIGLSYPRETDQAFYTEDSIPAFLAHWGISDVIVEIHVDPTIPAVLAN